MTKTSFVESVLVLTNVGVEDGGLIDNVVAPIPQMPQLGTTVYVGGHPSLGTQQALRVLTEAVPGDTPIFHWWDIDPDGTWIFRTIERAIGRSIQPHLVSAEIAERSGRIPPAKPAVARCPPESGIADIAVYLTGDNAKTLEQEELDPEDDGKRSLARRDALARCRGIAARPKAGRLIVGKDGAGRCAGQKRSGIEKKRRTLGVPVYSDEGWIVPPDWIRERIPVHRL